jgi:hypothetical protein
VASIDRYTDANAARATETNPPTSPYNFTIRKAQSIMNGFFTRIGVSQIRFPWIIPNINFSTSKIKLDTGLNLYTLVIQQGFYTPQQLAARMQATIRLLPGFATFSCFYGTDPSGVIFNSPRFVFNNEGSTPFTFLPMPPSYTNNPTYYPFNEPRRQLYDLLGLTTYNAPVGFYAPIILGMDTFCQYTNFIDIVCSNLTLNQSLKDDSTSSKAFDSLCRLYLTSPPQNVPCSDATFCPPGCSPQVLYNDYNNIKQIQWNGLQPIGQLTFQVLDDQGNVLNSGLDNIANVGSVQTGITGGEWNMSLLVTEN